MNENGDGATCKKCGKVVNSVEFFCAFCGRTTIISVEERLAKPAGRTRMIKMAVHDTVVFSSVVISSVAQYTVLK